jgi:hypothetical protein
MDVIRTELTGDERRATRIAMLRRVINELHCCEVEHLETVHVVENGLGRIIWEGDVEVFATRSTGRTRKCYAWVRRVGRRRHVRFFAVLETTVIKTALDAVKFAHVASSHSLIDEFSKLAERNSNGPPG